MSAAAIASVAPRKPKSNFFFVIALILGGFFLEKSSDDGRLPAYLLAGGIAALIPAIVVTLDATRYRPTEGAREDKPANDAAPSDPGQPGGSSVD